MGQVTPDVNCVASSRLLISKSSTSQHAFISMSAIVVLLDGPDGPLVPQRDARVQYLSKSRAEFPARSTILVPGIAND